MNWAALLLVVCCGVGYSNLTAWAGSFTITTTPDFDLIVQKRVERINQQITEQNAQNAAFNAANPKEPPKAISPAVTIEGYLRDHVAAILNAEVSAHQTEIFSNTKRAFDEAPPARKAAMCVALGLAGQLVECP